MTRIMESKGKCCKNVRGPVFPIPTPFTREGRVDYEGLARYVEFLLREGVTTLMVTIGTSRFDLLLPDEMLEVNKVVAQTVGDRGNVIVTTPSWGPTSQAVNFATKAAVAGADGVLLVFPERYYSDDQVFEFFKDVADESPTVDLLVHLAPMKAGRGGLGPNVHYSLELLERIFALPNMVGMKEESLDPGLSYAYSRKLSDDILIIGGAGGMKDFFVKHQWGQQAYLVGVGNITPKVELNFYRLLQKGDLNSAKRILFEIEEPIFQIAVKIGWHIALKEAMALKGLMGAWERKPLKRIEDKARSLLAEVMDDLQL